MKFNLISLLQFSTSVTIMDYSYYNSTNYPDQSTYTQLGSSQQQLPSNSTYQSSTQNVLPIPEPVSTIISYHRPKCYLSCKCSATQNTFGLVCPCNLPKVSVSTQTDNVVLNLQNKDYFTPQTTAYKLLQVSLIIYLILRY